MSSDHTPIAAQCRSDNLTPVHAQSAQGRSGSGVRSATDDQTVMRNLRWDHADVARYRAATGFYLQSVFDDLTWLLTRLVPLIPGHWIPLTRE